MHLKIAAKLQDVAYAKAIRTNTRGMWVCPKIAMPRENWWLFCMELDRLDRVDVGPATLMFGDAPRLQVPTFAGCRA